MVYHSYKFAVVFEAIKLLGNNKIGLLGPETLAPGTPAEPCAPTGPVICVFLLQPAKNTNATTPDKKTYLNLPILLSSNLFAMILIFLLAFYNNRILSVVYLNNVTLPLLLISVPSDSKPDKVHI